MSSKTRISIVALAIVSAVPAIWLTMTHKSLDERIRVAFEERRFEDVCAMTSQYEKSGELPDGLARLAAEAAQSIGRDEDVVHYSRISYDNSKSDTVAVSAALKIASAERRLGHVPESIEILELAVERFPTQNSLVHALAASLNRAGRRYEANHYIFSAIEFARLSSDDLIRLADRQEPYVDDGMESYLNSTDPVESPYGLTRAMIAWRSGRLADAAAILQTVVAAEPVNTEAHALMGIVLSQQGAMDRLPAWNAALPANADEHPDIWYVRGVWSEFLKRTTIASTCYRNALILDANLESAVFRLVEIHAHELAPTTRSKTASLLRATKDYKSVCKRIFFEGETSDLVAEAVRLAESADRIEEAIAWCRIRISLVGVTQSVKNTMRRLNVVREHRTTPRPTAIQDLLTSTSSGNSESNDLIVRSSELPPWPEATRNEPVDSARPIASFSEDSAAARLNFQYANGTEKTSGLMIRQSMGGGVGVLDLDRDGWPDLFFPQGSTLGSETDGLFRNQAGRVFQPVHELAGCGSTRFSHGAAIGDVNDDGFADILVANSGPNELFINNGDGTFRQASGAFKSTAWTISAAIVDLNDDAFPEIYEVNYLQGDSPFEKVCVDTFLKQPRACPPEQFSGEVNHLFANTGDGSFQDATLDTHLDKLTGKGLGIVATDFGVPGGLALFVANDQVANEFLTFERDGASGGRIGVARDTAAITGLAFDGSGDALACMGVATADANHDGYPDLFVTNFFGQSNTLYLSIEGNGYRDATPEAGLREPSLQTLGFGTQFLDANLDGEPDLIVGNGHLDDFTGKGVPYPMRPQLFMNRGEAGFLEASEDTAGAWFQQPGLARGISVLDWNRDGLQDFVVSRIQSRSSLLTNTTSTHGNAISLDVYGVASSRDAVGVTVEVQVGDSTRWGYVTSGDGYAGSNQHTLVFGTGSAIRADRLAVYWPDGAVLTFREVTAPGHYAVREDVEILFEVPG